MQDESDCKEEHTSDGLNSDGVVQSNNATAINSYDRNMFRSSKEVFSADL
jgi:hypothetical protein